MSGRFNLIIVRNAAALFELLQRLEAEARAAAPPDADPSTLRAMLREAAPGTPETLSRIAADWAAAARRR